MKALFAVLSLLIVPLAAIAAESETFQSIPNAYGIALKVPDNWKLDFQEARETKRSLSELLAVLELEKIRLLNTRTAPTSSSGYAGVRLNITATFPYSQAEVEAMSEAQLLAIKAEQLQELKNMDVRVFEMVKKTLTVSKTKTEDGFWVLRIAYIREGTTDDGPARVEQNYVTFKDRNVLLTLSHVISKKEVLEPILQRVWDSFRLENSVLWPRKTDG